MSRRSRELNQQAQERWPKLYQFLACSLHEEWPEMHGTPANAVATAVGEYPLVLRQDVLREWRNWNDTAGAVDDIRRLLNDGFGVCVHFKDPMDARKLMNSVYDRLIESVRTEHDKKWKP